MPFYYFKCKNPESPYFEEGDGRYSVFMSVKEYELIKNDMICPITKDPLIPDIGSTFVLKGKGWHKTGGY